MPNSLFKRIVVPIASPDDARTTCHALHPYLTDSTAEVLVAHVIEKAGGAPDKASVEQREEYAEEIFDVVADTFDDSGFTSFDTRIFYHTDVAEAIFEAADEVDATAIVFTPRETSRWVRLITGDVALSLVTKMDRPVIVLPEREGIQTDG